MSTQATPLVSVVMANFNGAAHIAEAVRSVLGQSGPPLELILSDDGSSDDSIARAESAAAGDQRLVVLRSGRTTGPGGARNRALAVARAEWVAIVDSDDAIEEGRLARLVTAAEADGADIVADNLLTFYEDASRAPHAHLGGALGRSPSWISASDYAESNILLSGGAQLGYLKPLFRRGLLRSVVYDETLAVGEDSDLVLRLLLSGARMRVYPDLGYRYRKHSRSTSHRLKTPAIDAMLAALDRLQPGEDLRLRRALARQRNALLDARAFSELVVALKDWNIAAAAYAAARRPSALLLLRDPIKARLSRRRA